jgi:hypothetical protein
VGCGEVECIRVAKGTNTWLAFVNTVLIVKNAVVWDVRVRVTLRLAVYRQSVSLGDKPLETHDQ